MLVLPEMPPAIVAGLRTSVMAFAVGRYAVMDGHYDPDLGGRLRAIGISGSPLYRANESAVDIWAGPILIDLTNAAHATLFFDTIQASCGAVFWHWPESGAALHRHLRTLNMARIPAEPDQQPQGDSASAEDIVLFRHYDPDALAPVLPVLTPPQQARILGDARGITFAAEDYGGVVSVPRPDLLPRTSAGPLRLDAAQMARVDDLRRAASHRRIARFLFGELPNVGMDQSVILARVPTYDAQARALGLTTEGDIARWAYLQLISNEKLFDMPVVQDSFRPEVRRCSASEYLDLLYDGIIDQFRRQG
jgi:hypothetical protein